MEHNVKFIKSENQLNKVIKKQRKEGSYVKILFVSLWDKWSNALVSKLKKTSRDKGTLVFVVDSFSMPHSFVIYKTRKTPSLVTLGRKNSGPIVEDYMPAIYDSLGI